MAVLEEEAARAAVAFDKGVFVRWAKRGVRTLLLRAVRVAPMTILFNVPAVLLSVTASAFRTSLFKLGAFASQPILALAVNQKGFRAARFAGFLSVGADPRSSASRQSRLATWHLAHATFSNTCPPARTLSCRNEARSSAARFCAAHTVEQVVAVAALEAGACVRVAIFAVAIFGTAITRSVRGRRSWRDGGCRVYDACSRWVDCTVAGSSS